MTAIRKPLAKFVEWPEPKIFGGVVKYTIVYTQPNYSDPTKEWKHQAVEADLSNEAIDRLVDLKKGDLFCVHLGRTDDNWPLILDITDAKDADAKQEGGKAYTKGSGGKSYDQSGPAVGGAFSFAIDILRHGLKLEDVLALVDKIIPEAEARKKVLQAANKVDADKKEAAEKPLTRAELAKQRKEAEKDKPAEAKANDTEPTKLAEDEDGNPTFDKE